MAPSSGSPTFTFIEAGPRALELISIVWEILKAGKSTFEMKFHNSQ